MIMRPAGSSSSGGVYMDAYLYNQEPCPSCRPLPCLVDLWLLSSSPASPSPLTLKNHIITRLLNQFSRHWTSRLHPLLQNLDLSPIMRRKIEPFKTLKSIPGTLQELLDLLTQLTHNADSHNSVLLESLNQWFCNDGVQKILLVLEVLKLIGAKALKKTYRPLLYREICKVVESPGHEREVDTFAYLLLLETTEETWRNILIHELYQHLFFGFAIRHLRKMESALNAEAHILPDDMVAEFANLTGVSPFITTYASLYRSFLNHLSMFIVVKPKITLKKTSITPFIRKNNQNITIHPAWHDIETSRRKIRLACLSWLRALEHTNSVWLVLESMQIGDFKQWAPILNVQLSALLTYIKEPLKQRAVEEPLLSLLIMGNFLMITEVLVDLLYNLYADAIVFHSYTDRMPWTIV